MARGILGEIEGAGQRAADGLAQVFARLSGGDLRLGVTGLRRSGKTVFVTSLLHNLLTAGRLPFLDVMSQGRFIASRLQPQPDPAVPRFDFEGRLAELTAELPRWPENTKAVSEIRIALRFRPVGLMRRNLGGIATLNLDIVDYPGEWLLDLPMLGQGFAEWSRQTLDLSLRPPRDELSRRWREYLRGVDATADADEAVARRLAALYTDYLKACRASSVGLSLVQPGRFVEPGEMEGAPVLTFCPLPPQEAAPPDSLYALMAERFEGYKEKVVRRFFRDHFGRLDRQIVLVDVLSALNAGAPGLEDLHQSLAATLESFRHGRTGWLNWLGGSRIEKVLFAATKADHVAASQHGNLRSLLESFLSGSLNSVRYTGAAVDTMAIASVKCTETVLTEYRGRPLACVQGVPAGRTEQAVIFPGEIPASHHDVGPTGEGRFNFLPFLPPQGLGRDGRGLPNIRIDQALQFLVGDRLA
ncbi:YcjX family protein [Rhodocista pekingensis]|uniref:YcjX family protein n=1 Tax=Rhodocista pekingensis TaxID=201185 RepID=A0ABW2KS47_9PROT